MVSKLDRKRLVFLSYSEYCKPLNYKLEINLINASQHEPKENMNNWPEIPKNKIIESEQSVTKHLQALFLTDNN